MVNNPKKKIDTEAGSVVPYINAYCNAYQMRFDRVVLVDLAEQRTPPIYLMPEPLVPKTEEYSK